MTSAPGHADSAALLRLAEQAAAGDRRALARLLTRLENRPPAADAANAYLYPRAAAAHLIGITGAPGTGKSTLAAALAAHFRRAGHPVAILAVDPSSPYTGGAILGDRVRMGALHGDAGVFIRSMAARGEAGGLAPAARDCARALAAAGFSIVLIETVGAGQNEVAVAQVADSVVVVEAPGLGDDVQAIKAGILETADVLVVNKADKPGAASTAAALRDMLGLGHPTRAGHHGAGVGSVAAQSLGHAPLWIPPVLETVAAGDVRGIDALADALAAHRAYLAENGRAAVASRHTGELREAFLNLVWQNARDRISAADWHALHHALATRTISPAGAARALFERFIESGPDDLFSLSPTLHPDHARPGGTRPDDQP